MNKKHIPLLLITSLLMVACNNTQNYEIKSPNEDKGLEANADNDKVELKDKAVLEDVLERAAKTQYYSYEVTSKVIGNESHFIDHFAPNAWYEESDNNSESFGYAQEKNNKSVFKYYLQNNEVIPSVYEYTGLGDGIIKLTGLYGSFSIANISLLEECLEESFNAKYLGLNKFLITDSNTASVFQYMTTFGGSITNYLVATYIDVIDEKNLIFRVTCDLGTYGSIEALFTPTTKENSKINIVEEALTNGLKGIDSYDDMNEFFFNKISSNNYILHGVKQRIKGVESKVIPYTIYCTNNYFYLDYEDQNYQDYGYALIPANKEITYYEMQSDGSQLSKTQTLKYSACYEFSKQNDGTFIFSLFKGPLEGGGLTYLEVNVLPETGEFNTIYIINENGSNVAYEYTEISDGVYGFTKFGNWNNSVGDFYINDSMATFYLGSTALGKIGPNYYEKSLDNDNIYFSNNSSVMGALANGLFGWGFQGTTTWMDYIKNSKITINRDDNSNIISYDIGLELAYYENGSYIGLGEIYYTIDNFNQGNLYEIEYFLNQTLGGTK